MEPHRSVPHVPLSAIRVARRRLAAAATCGALVLAVPVVDLSASAQPTVVTPTVDSRQLTDAPTVSVSADDAAQTPSTQGQPSAGPGSAASAAAKPVREATVEAHGAMAALSWPRGTQPGEGTSVSLRAVRADGSEGEWVSAAVTAMTDSGGGSRAGRMGTDAVWLGPFVAVKVRYPASLRGLAVAHVEVIDPGTSRADARHAGPAASASAVADQPTIITRAEWGADESLRGGCVPQEMPSLDGVVLHHDAGSNDYSAKDSAAIIRGFYAYHTRTLGWCDVGYNIIVDKYGQIFEGRKGSIGRNIRGAHALGFNDGTLGVSMLGNYMTATPTTAGIDAVVRVLAWKLDAAQLRGDAIVTWRGGYADTRYAAGSVFQAPVIIAHRDVNFTDCPGTNYYPLLAQIRTRVAAAQSGFADIAPANQFRMQIAWMANEGISTGWAAGGQRWYRPLESVNRDAMAAFMYRLAGSPEFTPPARSPFADVAPSNPYYTEITWLAQARISWGWREADGRRTFRPGSPVSREAMAAFMYRFDQYLHPTDTSTSTLTTDPTTVTSPFVDVPVTHPFFAEIAWMAERGISTGWESMAIAGEAEYRPAEPVARDAMAAFMARL